jgi:hypothetical protein
MSDDPRQADSGSASSLAGLASKIRNGKQTAAQAEYDARPPKISITHRRTGSASGRITGLASAIRVLVGTATKPLISPPLNVELDGLLLATIDEGERFEIVTTAGSHRLRILSTVGHSTRDLELTNGQRLRFWCLNSISGVVFQHED